MPKNIKILQINLARAQLATTEAANFAALNGYDIMLLQEPYAVKNIPWRSSNTTRIITANQHDQYPWAAILITNPELRSVNIKQAGNQHLAVAYIESEHWNFYIASIYLQHSEDPGPMLAKLENLIIQTTGKCLIIGGDMNATSTTWGANNTNDRGTILEDFITIHNLTIINDPTQPPTFSTGQGTSYIDVTLAKGNISHQTTDWRVLEDQTSSDHNLITFSITKNHNRRPPQSPAQNTARFCTKILNPTSLNHALTHSMNQLQALPLETPTEIEAFSEILEHKIFEICNRQIPRKKQPTSKVKWWTPELTTYKRRTYRARRRMQTANNDLERTELRRNFISIRNQYRKTVRKTRKESWRKFVEEQSSNNTWGIIYKLMNQRLNPREAMTAITGNDTHTGTWDETANALLDAFVIRDNPEEDNINQHDTRTNAKKRMPLTGHTPDISPTETTNIIKSLKNGKTPGPDLLEVTILKTAWPTIGPQYNKLFNACLKTGTFPKNWKRGRIHAILKDKSKDPTITSSYRPICLLPIPGKILEKIILRNILEHTQELFKHQYGFIKGKSTTDAALRLTSKIKKANTKYVLGIFVDIKGAFDHVWWPNILQALQKTNCPPETYNIIHHYLQDRTIIIEEQGKIITRPQERGCPQGSVLGPILWNLVFDDLIETLKDGQTKITAYADDVAILLTANSRKDLETAGNRATGKLSEWCTLHKLTISTDKTVAMMLKGKLDQERMPRITLLGTRLQYKNNIRYLGIQIGTNTTFTNHIKNISTKAKTTLNNMAAVARANWGVRHEALLQIYKGTFIPIITYAAPVWAGNLTKRDAGYLCAAQRWALIRCTRAYRTISTPAAPVLAGVQRITDNIETAILRYLYRKGKTYQISGITYGPENGTLKEETARLVDHQLDRWQSDWTHETKGRTTREFFPNIRARLKATWITPDYYTSQILTGHGNFKNKLHALGLSNTDRCSCGRKDTSRHATLYCPNLREIRRELRRALEEEEWTWPPPMWAFTTQDCFPTFKNFATRALQHKESTTRAELHNPAHR